MGDQQKNKNLFFYTFIISVLAISVVVLMALLVNLSNTKESLAISRIDQTTEDANHQFDNYFNRLKGNLMMVKQLCDQGILDATKSEINETYWLPVIHNYPPINTIALVNENGHESSLIYEDTTWLSNIVFESQDSGIVIERKRWKGNLFEKETLKEWIEYNAAYNPRLRPWYIEAMHNKFPEEPWWTDPYIFYTVQQPGITASVKSYCPDTKQSQVLEYDILLSEISDFTTKEHVSTNGKTFVMTKDLKVIGLPDEPHLSTPDSISKYVLKPYDQIGSETITQVVNTWKTLVSDTFNVFSLTIDDKKWWVKISNFKLGKNKEFLVGVAVPENDFLSEVNRSRNVVIGGFVIVLIVILIVVRQYMVKVKMNILLAEQKEQISHQKDFIEHQKQVVEKAHHEVKASINYAERIQAALLSTEEHWQNVGAENFIYFQPRDVVSGDFYWAFSNRDLVFWVAADCTGHGVPGAFMSMLGISFLNEIVSEGGETNSGKILDKLRNKILTSLKQKGEEQRKDGMDLALCVFNKSTLQLQFSGAYNPLLIIRKSTEPEIDGFEKKMEDYGHTLYEFKADRMPIGRFQIDSTPFQTQNIQLRKGDVLYTFSDGYQDQFGGKDAKKFMIKRMKKLLLSIQNQPMTDQKITLESELNSWMNTGKTTQIDDICVIGVRI